eukprot:171472-Chlamydomonas_euryale.AAC.1
MLMDAGVEGALGAVEQVWRARLGRLSRCGQHVRAHAHARTNCVRMEADLRACMYAWGAEQVVAAPPARKRTSRNRMRAFGRDFLCRRTRGGRGDDAKPEKRQTRERGCPHVHSHPSPDRLHPPSPNHQCMYACAAADGGSSAARAAAGWRGRRGRGAAAAACAAVARYAHVGVCAVGRLHG